MLPPQFQGRLADLRLAPTEVVARLEGVGPVPEQLLL
jgi:hypothetical protein